MTYSIWRVLRFNSFVKMSIILLKDSHRIRIFRQTRQKVRARRKISGLVDGKQNRFQFVSINNRNFIFISNNSVTDSDKNFFKKTERNRCLHNFILDYGCNFGELDFLVNCKEFGLVLHPPSRL